ncbi:MAG TPA: HD domain-containing protein [Verrucomicrobiae bacterium]|jgi:hypothetical protein
MFPGSDGNFVRQAFEWATDCFEGRFAGYQAVDTRYHDFEHTLQGTLCMARILNGRHGAGAKPELTEKYFELGLLAILLHDTGYLKKQDDTKGTGAKYTAIHVLRSVDFAASLLTTKKFDAEAIRAVQNMISCTGVDAALEKIPFQSELEKTTGFALGAADLLGQMAAEDYVEKLPVLYSEFEEAAAYNRGQGNFKVMFSSADDLMQKTPQFWEKFVLPKLEKDFKGIHRFLNSPYPDGPNFYQDRVEANISQLKKQLAAKQNIAARA